jgi:GAF domain-containing protein/HAMP domain-containing protein
MMDPKPFKPTHSIRLQMLLLLLGISTAAVISITIIAIRATQSQGQSAQQISTAALLAQAEDYLVQLTAANATENDQVLGEIVKASQNLASYTTAIYANSGTFTSETYWPAENHMSYLAEGQYANDVHDLSSAFVPNTALVNDQVIQDLEISAYLDLNLAAFFQNTPNIEAIYFATAREVVRYYPNVNLGEVLPPDFKATERIWFSGSLPDQNPQRTTWWTPVYVDATGLGLVTTAATPVYDKNGELLGVIGFDVTLTGMKASVEEARFLNTGYSFLVENHGQAIALPEQGYRDILGIDPDPENISPNLLENDNAFTPVLHAMQAGQQGLEQITIGNRKLFVAYAPLPSAGWSIGSVVDEQDVLQSVYAMRSEMNETTRSLLLGRILPVSLAIFAGVVVLGLFATNQQVKSIRMLANTAQKIGNGDWEARIDYQIGNEVGLLAHSLNSMAEQLKQNFQQLEARVQERTHELERRSSQVQVAAEIARDATQVVASAEGADLDQLLRSAVQLIRDRFGFYHAGIFLMDEAHEYAVLRAATGDAGQAMLERGHKLKAGETGIVGYATGKGQPRITLDVSADPNYYNNPLLPETQSEMALPLRVGERVIGALDVQSRTANAFDEDDVTILQVLADQLAVAIENTRLLQEVQTNLKELEQLYSQYSDRVWREIRETSNPAGYIYERGNVRPLLTREIDSLPRPGNGNGFEKTTMTSKQPYSIPLRVRDTVIGSLDVWPGEKGFSAGEIELVEAASSRISQAMESARLYQETQRQARQEQLLGEVTTRIRETLNIDTVLQTAVVEMQRRLNLAQVEIRIGTDYTPEEA